MTHIRATLTRARSNRTALRAERALQRALAGAPTVESAHEIAVISTRR